MLQSRNRAWMSSFLAQWLDPGLKIPEEETADKITRAERERLSRLAAVAKAAGSMPRRLGGDANAKELASDKQYCRRIEHVATQCATAWGGALQVSGDVGREAAIVKWDKWCQDHKVWLTNRMKYIATWASNGGDPKFAKSALVKLQNELRWVEYAMR